jgi:hypothetical protein
MPNHYLAIDIGSSTVAAVIIDLDSKSVVGSASAVNTAEITSPDDKKIGRSEWDLEVMTELAVKNAADLITTTGADPAAIGVTGQQQGLQLLDNDLNAASMFISWQDQRSKEFLPGEQCTYLGAMGDLGGAVAYDPERLCQRGGVVGVALAHWLISSPGPGIHAAFRPGRTRKRHERTLVFKLCPGESVCVW